MLSKSLLTEAFDLAFDEAEEKAIVDYESER